MFNAFTEEREGIVNVLYTKCGVCEAISVEELKKGANHPKVIEVHAIWDTGASASAISKNVVKALELIPTGKGISSTAGGVLEVETYTINVLLPCNVGISSVQVSCNDLGDTDMLIGMDIISKGDFSITNNNGHTKFSFQMPSTHNIDYKSELEKYQKIHTEWVKHGNNRCPCGSGKQWNQCHGK
jgi:uncharacterized protein YchJ